MENQQDQHQLQTGNPNLPPGLQYRQDPAVVRAQMGFEALMEASERKVKTSNHMQAKQAQQDHNIPMFQALAQWMFLQQLDTLQYVQNLVASASSMMESTEEVMVGIPEETAEDMLSALEDICDIVSKKQEKSEKKWQEKMIKAVRKKTDALADIVNSLVLDDDADDDEEDEDDGEYEPLIADDEPIPMAAEEDHPDQAQAQGEV